MVDISPDSQFKPYVFTFTVKAAEAIGSMSGSSRRSIALLLCLIGFQLVLCAPVIPSGAKPKAAKPANIQTKSANVNVVPQKSSIASVKDYSEDFDNSYGPSYEVERPDASYEDKGPYSNQEGLDDHGYSEDAESPYYDEYAAKPDITGDNKPTACPKAMSADAVEDVFVAKTEFEWLDLASLRAAPKRTKHHASKVTQAAHGKARMSQAASNAATAASSAKAATASVGIASVGTAASKPAYGGHEPKFLLPLNPEVTGDGFTGTYSNDMIPTAEALAVGPHTGHDANPTFVTILHAVNAVAEITYATKKTGRKINSMTTPTKVSLIDIAAKVLGSEVEEQLVMANPSAFYDCKEERWVLVWTSMSNMGEGAGWTPSLFVAVSHSIDPLGRWTVYALDARPMVTVGYRFAEAGGPGFSPLSPQVSYSSDGIFISIGASYSQPNGMEAGILSVLFAYSKHALYNVEHDNPKIYAASYLGSGAWKSSVSYEEQCLIEDEYRTFNNLITPARPQDKEDVSAAPLFVMKVNGAYLSVATLTDEPLDKMDCLQNAPKIRAIVTGKGEDFSNKYGLLDGSATMPQPETDVVLDSGDTGMLGGVYAIRTYGTVHSDGFLYTTMSEFFGKGDMRMPSIFWAIISTHPGSGLCKADRKAWGVIASENGLALAYPVIGARKDRSAMVVYSFSGMQELPHSLGPAYPGVASTIVNGKNYDYQQGPSIDIVKLGAGPVDQVEEHDDSNIARWGDYSAMQAYEGRMWYAIPYAEALPDGQEDEWRAAYRSHIGVADLMSDK